MNSENKILSCTSTHECLDHKSSLRYNYDHEELEVLSTKIERHLNLFSIESRNVGMYIENVLMSVQQYCKQMYTLETETETKTDTKADTKADMKNANDLEVQCLQETIDITNEQDHPIPCNTANDDTKKEEVLKIRQKKRQHHRKLYKKARNDQNKMLQSGIIKEGIQSIENSSVVDDKCNNDRCRKIAIFAQKLKLQSGKEST